MDSEARRRVAAVPAKPLLIFDGDCGFCRRWVERWREQTGDRVEYASSQEVATRFPEIPPEEFQRAVQLVETDGRVFSGAEAVFHSLGGGGLWSYERVPGFAAASEFAYGVISSRRTLASAGTRLLWGGDVRRPTYFTARRWFLRVLGLIYLIAFVSLWTQVDGLVGGNGIEPVVRFLEAARAQLGTAAPYALPTLCWLNSSNGFLHFLCGSGAAVSVLLIIGIAPVLCLGALFAAYLSLTIAGQTFLSFQWDILLLEAGFLAIFLAPLQWLPNGAREAPVSRVGLFLLKLLLFKLMLMSGAVKLTSGDDSWWNLTALDYHYWTQPLPTVGGWWAAQNPEWLKHASVAFVLLVEMVVPWFIWAPRRLRVAAAGLLVLLQVLIALTGNYTFFNLLSAALCLLLVDDAAWPMSRTREVVGRSWPRWITAAVIAVTLPLNAWLVLSSCKPEIEMPRVLAALAGVLEPFHIVNGYGLFRVMTKERHEIVIEGSEDGAEWKPYEFEWKPGDVARRPGWVAPHQPRLDWQMWFAALGTARENRWFVGLLVQLLHGSADVTRLFAQNPFPDSPPRYVRAQLYDYHFATAAEHQATGAWWKRARIGEYCPPVSLHAEDSELK